jgi:hypothetical protein
MEPPPIPAAVLEDWCGKPNVYETSYSGLFLEMVYRWLCHIITWMVTLTLLGLFDTLAPRASPGAARKKVRSKIASSPVELGVVGSKAQDWHWFQHPISGSISDVQGSDSLWTPQVAPCIGGDVPDTCAGHRGFSGAMDGDVGMSTQAAYRIPIFTVTWGW